MRSEFDHDGCEYGGWLFGTRTAARIVVADATGAGPDANRGPGLHRPA